MSDANPERPAAPPAGASGSGLTYKQTESGVWTLERAREERRDREREHLQREAAEEAQHRRDEELKDNNLRRQREQMGFYVIVVVVVGMLIVGFILSVWSNDANTRQWAQGFVTLILGGVLGGLAGYFTGKIGK